LDSRGQYGWYFLGLICFAFTVSACTSQDSLPTESPTPASESVDTTPTPTVEVASSVDSEGNRVTDSDREIIRDAIRSVVRIDTELSGGTGFVVNDPEGNLAVVTNAHVVEGASNVRVIDPDGEAWTVTEIFDDPLVDLALLTAPGLRITPLDLADEEIDVTDPVWVIGFPLLMPGEPTVTQGVVSSRRQIDNISYLQIDAAINPGNSGGPVLNEQGEIVGVATWKLVGDTTSPVENIGFALPSSRVHSLLNTAAVGVPRAVLPQFDDVPAMAPEQGELPSDPRAADEVQRLFQELPGIGAGVVILPNGDVIDRFPNRQAPAGSMIKLWIAAAALEDAENGRLDLGSSHTIRAEDQAPGTGILNQPFHLGRSITYADLLQTMLLYSDNSAANIIVDRIGGFDRVNQYARLNGYSSTLMQRNLGYLDPGLENYTSAHDCALFFVSLLVGDVVNDDASIAILDILDLRRAHESPELDFFGRSLPSNAQYLHLSGILPKARNEAGFMVTSSGQWVFIALLLDELPDVSAGEWAISSTIRRIHDIAD
jgi:beta-lactamase class A